MSLTPAYSILTTPIHKNLIQVTTIYCQTLSFTDNQLLPTTTIRRLPTTIIHRYYPTTPTLGRTANNFTTTTDIITTTIISSTLLSISLLN